MAVAHWVDIDSILIARLLIRVGHLGLVGEPGFGISLPLKDGVVDDGVVDTSEHRAIDRAAVSERMVGNTMTVDWGEASSERQANVRLSRDAGNQSTSSRKSLHVDFFVFFSVIGFPTLCSIG